MRLCSLSQNGHAFEVIWTGDSAWFEAHRWHSSAQCSFWNIRLICRFYIIYLFRLCNHVKSVRSFSSTPSVLPSLWAWDRPNPPGVRAPWRHLRIAQTTFWSVKLSKAVQEKSKGSARQSRRLSNSEAHKKSVCPRTVKPFCATKKEPIEQGDLKRLKGLA